MLYVYIVFLFANKLLNIEVETLKNRISRLYIPVMFWSVTYFIIINLTLMFNNDINSLIGFKKLIVSLMLGHAQWLASPLWFLISQIFILLILFICFIYIKTKEFRIYSLILLFVFAFFLQYFGILSFILDTSSYELKYPLGRTVECLPCAVGGLLYALCLKNKSFKLKLFALILFIILAIGSKVFPIFNIQNNFGYGGFALTFASISICILAVNIPITFGNKINLYINKIANFTMGIYCMHLLVGRELNFIFPEVLYQGTLIFCSIIFVISFLFSLLICYIKGKLNYEWLDYIV